MQRQRLFYRHGSTNTMTSTDTDTDSALENLHRCLQEHLSIHQITNPAIIGIHTGGAWVAAALAEKMGQYPDQNKRDQDTDQNIPMGSLDISFYRDDFSRIGINPEVRPSSIPFEVDEKHIILVDDVLYTGRTIRAALNEIFDYGRPASVILAVLIERNGRQLPISADCVGSCVSLEPRQQIKLSGPSPLSMEIISTP